MPPQNTWLFNTNQLASFEEARNLRDFLMASPYFQPAVIAPETQDPTQSGIFIPEWVGGPGGFPEPNYTDPVTHVKYFFLHYRWSNGFVGNVGLIIDKFRRYPFSSGYVMRVLGEEVKAFR